MRSFNKKKKEKHTTKIKIVEFLGIYYLVFRNSKTSSIADGLFGNLKIKKYTMNF